jgi:flagellar operon protein
MRVDSTFLKYGEAIGKVFTDNTVNKIKDINSTGNNFETVFNEAQKNLSFSKHALKRIDERDIEITDEEMDKLNSAVEMAETKGIKDSLILMNNKAFIVNISSNIVVTVLDSSEINEQKIFTNLDGAVIL